jgi:Cd2+/Zn2+-exporting ATPase
VDEIEKAGAFDHITVAAENERIPKKAFLKRYLTLEISIILLLAGYFTGKIGVLFFAAAIITGGYSLFKTGLQNLIRLQFDMKTLMTIAIIGAAVIGQWSEGAVVVILFAISEVLESFSMEKARGSIRSLMELSPQGSHHHPK